MSDIAGFKKLVDESSRIVGFTGAGISTEAGISDYRSQGGIWEKFTPVYLSEFIDDPEKHKWSGSYGQSTKETLFKCFQIMGNDRQVVVHITGKRQGESLAADNDVPTH